MEVAGFVMQANVIQYEIVQNFLLQKVSSQKSNLYYVIPMRLNRAEENEQSQ